MRVRAKLAIALLCGFCVCSLRSQDKSRPPTHPTLRNLDAEADNDRTLSEDDRLSVIVAALDARSRIDSESDCSHLVHAIYQQAGFPYDYAPSSEIYAGIEGFQRVKVPQPGDLVAWRGHAGIVIQPSQHIFFSFLHSGPGIDDYDAAYWKKRGHPRFYRYVKNDSCAGCANRRRQLLKIKR